LITCVALDVVPSGGARLSTATRVIDGTGAFVIPGLWDMHAHLNIPTDPARQQLPLFIASGTTPAVVALTTANASARTAVSRVRSQFWSRLHSRKPVQRREG
jgi:imidazolonepropionase-like amidohydrolase